MATPVWHVFTVEGHREFPTDMLRYDVCFPARQEDVYELLRAGRHDARERTTYRITLRSYRAPTVPRWASFGWTVTDQRKEK